MTDIRYYEERSCEVCGLYEHGEHFDQVGDWCDGAGAVRREIIVDYAVAARVLDGYLGFDTENFKIARCAIDAALGRGDTREDTE